MNNNIQRSQTRQHILLTQNDKGQFLLHSLIINHIPEDQKEQFRIKMKLDCSPEKFSKDFERLYAKKYYLNNGFKSENILIDARYAAEHMIMEKNHLKRDYESDFDKVSIDKSSYKNIQNSIDEISSIQKSSILSTISHTNQSKPGNKDIPFLLSLRDFNKIDMKRNNDTREYYAQIEDLFAQNKTLSFDTKCKVRSYLVGKELVEITNKEESDNSRESDQNNNQDSEQDSESEQEKQIPISKNLDSNHPEQNHQLAIVKQQKNISELTDIIELSSIQCNILCSKDYSEFEKQLMAFMIKQRLETIKMQQELQITKTQSELEVSRAQCNEKLAYKDVDVAQIKTDVAYKDVNIARMKTSMALKDVNIARMETMIALKDNELLKKDIEQLKKDIEAIYKAYKDNHLYFIIKNTDQLQEELDSYNQHLKENNHLKETYNIKVTQRSKPNNVRLYQTDDHNVKESYFVQLARQYPKESCYLGRSIRETRKQEHDHAIASKLIVDGVPKTLVELMVKNDALYNYVNVFYSEEQFDKAEIKQQEKDHIKEIANIEGVQLINVQHNNNKPYKRIPGWQSFMEFLQKIGLTKSK